MVIAVVKYENGCFLAMTDRNSGFNLSDKIEVIGNIHDNPELLEVEQMKAVLLSIRAKYCERIANGKKTVDVRKTRPKIEPPFKCYIYCTKRFDKSHGTNGYFQGKYCGKVIGEFICDTIIIDRTLGYDNLFNAIACLDVGDIAAYCLNDPMYGWHISDLVVYDEPKELSEFGLKRPPQSWNYVVECEK